MSETLSSFFEWAHKRATTAIIGTYIGFWATLHWQAIYITFFVSEDKVYDKFHLLKNEYINTYFIQWRGWDTVLGYLIPLLLTYLFIWILPEFLFLRAFKKERNYKTARRMIIIQGDAEVEKEKTKLVKESAKVLDAQREAAKIEKDLEEIDPSRAFDEEYSVFIEIPNAGETISRIKSVIYDHHGSIKRYRDADDEQWYDPDVSSDMLARADANGLINLDLTKSQASLTEKGREFIKRFDAENPTKL